MAAFLRNCAEQKVQTGSAAAGGHRRVATRETTGDLATRRGAGDPVTRAEWMKVLRYGHLRSALVVVVVGYARSGNRLHSLQPCRSPRASLGASSMASCLSSMHKHVVAIRRGLCSGSSHGVPRDPCQQLIFALTGCGRHCATLHDVGCPKCTTSVVHLSGVYRKLTRRSRRSREFAGFYRFPPIFALAGCGRRCAVLLASTPPPPPPDGKSSLLAPNASIEQKCCRQRCSLFLLVFTVL